MPEYYIRPEFTFPIPPAPCEMSLPITPERLAWLMDDVLTWEPHRLARQLGLDVKTVNAWRSGKKMMPNRCAVWLEMHAAFILAHQEPLFWTGRKDVGEARHPDGEKAERSWDPVGKPQQPELHRQDIRRADELAAEVTLNFGPMAELALEQERSRRATPGTATPADPWAETYVGRWVDPEGRKTKRRPLTAAATKADASSSEAPARRTSAPSRRETP